MSKWWEPQSVSELIRCEHTVMHPYWIRRMVDQINNKIADSSSDEMQRRAFLRARRDWLCDKYYQITRRVLIG